jgi:hypothetical protein
MYPLIPWELVADRLGSAEHALWTTALYPFAQIKLYKVGLKQNCTRTKRIILKFEVGFAWRWITRANILIVTKLIFKNISFFFFHMAGQPLGGQRLLIFRGFAITLFRHTTLGSTPLDERPARRRDLYLTTRNTHKRQTSMPPAGFEPTNPANERP